MALRRSNHRPLIQPNLNRLAESPLPRNGAGAFCFPRYTPPSLLAVSENANTFPEDERTSPVGRRRGGATGLMSLVLGGFISGFGQKKIHNPHLGLWIMLWIKLFTGCGFRCGNRLLACGYPYSTYPQETPAPCG